MKFQTSNWVMRRSTMIDEGKLNVFIGQMLGDLGGASSVAMVRLGGLAWPLRDASCQRPHDLHPTSQSRHGARAVSAGMALPSGGLQLFGLRSQDGNILVAARAGSTMICLPTLLSQEVAAGLGAQAGEKKLREVITSGG